MKVSPHQHLGGLSPNEKAYINKFTATRLVYNFGFSSDQLITRVLNKMATGWAAAQVDKGWLVKTRCPGGQPRHIYTLTHTSLEWIEKRVESVHHYPEIDTNKINWSNLAHTLFGQNVMLNEIGAANFKAYSTERQLNKGDKLGVKRPDMVFYYEQNERCAIEVELTGKWQQKMDDFVLKIVRDLTPRQDGSSVFSRYAIVSDSKAVLNRYREVFRTGQPVKEWSKDSRGHWEIKNMVAIPEDIAKRVRFVFYEVD